MPHSAPRKHRGPAFDHLNPLNNDLSPVTLLIFRCSKTKITIQISVINIKAIVSLSDSK